VSRTLSVLDREGQALAQTVELPGDVFDVVLNVPLIHQVVVAQLAAARQGTHDTKTRGEVRGGGKKPYRQKGTGRARQGSIRAPQFVGGGVVHGPTPQDFSQRTPKKMKAAALRAALSDRARGGKVHVMQGFVVGETPSTKAAAVALAAVSTGRSVLVVADRADSVTWKSLRNVDRVHLIAPGQLNTYDVLCSDDVVFTEGALAAFLAGPPRGKSRSARATSGEVTDGEPTANDLAAAVEVLGGPGVGAPADQPDSPTTTSTATTSTATTSTATTSGGTTSSGTTSTATTSTATTTPTTTAGASVSETSGSGETTTAGTGVSDEELVREVTGQTSSDLEVEGAFERESGGAATDTEAAKATADDLEDGTPTTGPAGGTP